MRDVLGPGTILGYCTNVHAGESLEQAMDTLRKFTAAVKQKVSPSHPMEIGWWLSARAVLQFCRNFDETLAWVKPGLRAEELVPFTFNGFPYGDFHDESIKHRVYEPSWSEYDRLAYTECLIHLMVLLSNSTAERSISTLPIGWPCQPCRPVNLDGATDNVLGLVEIMRQAEADRGILIHIDLEPEPGCILKRSEDVVVFFKERLLPNARKHNLDEETVLRHIRVCHDVCHAAVMYEDQAEMFARYRAAGIKIGKVQISNAVRADLRGLSAGDRTETLAQLRRFSEDRYLHQTMIQTGDSLQFFDDLPEALTERGQSDRAGDEWRVHFHVPVYLEEFGLLQTTRDHIIECMRLLKGSEVKHWEVETYAWDVLPDELKVADLADGIARELLWVMDQAAAIK